MQVGVPFIVTFPAFCCVSWFDAGQEHLIQTWWQRIKEFRESLEMFPQPLIQAGLLLRATQQLPRLWFSPPNSTFHFHFLLFVHLTRLLHSTLLNSLADFLHPHLDILSLLHKDAVYSNFGTLSCASVALPLSLSLCPDLKLSFISQWHCATFDQLAFLMSLWKNLCFNQQHW